VLRLKPCQLRCAVDPPVGIEVEIDSEYPATWPRRNSDQRVRRLPPPCRDLKWVSGRVFEAVRRQGSFAAFDAMVAGEHGPPIAGEAESGLPCF
jgi:hypothetical protein